MAFLNPLFLFGLFAVPIPFIIHLVARTRMQKKFFPSIQLLRKAEKGERGFLKLKDIILLIIRTLAILLLVFAFANPVIRRKARLVILDNSYTMHPLFEKGKEIALKLQRKGAFCILTSGEELNKDAKWVYKKFSLLDLPERSCVITEKDKPVKQGIKKIEIKSSLAGQAKNSLGIDSLFILNPLSDNPKVCVIIRNFSKIEKEVIAELSMGENLPVSRRASFEKRALIQPSSVSTVIFPLNKTFTKSSGFIEIRGRDDFEIDNRRYFTYPKQEPLKVLIVGQESATFYVKNALSPPGVSTPIEVKISGTPKPNFDVMIFMDNRNISIPERSLVCCLSPTSHISRPSFLNLSRIDFSHPVFWGLNKKEIKQIKFIPADTTITGRVIAYFSDGAPAIVEKSSSIGFQPVIYFLFLLTKEGGDFVLSPLFVPFIYNTVYYLAGEEKEKQNFLVGDQARFKVVQFRPYKCVTPQGVTTLFPKQTQTGLYVYITPEIMGNYRLENVKDFSVNISKEYFCPNISIEEDTWSELNLKKLLLLFVLGLLIIELIVRKIGISRF